MACVMAPQLQWSRVVPSDGSPATTCAAPTAAQAFRATRAQGFVELTARALNPVPSDNESSREVVMSGACDRSGRAYRGSRPTTATDRVLNATAPVPNGNQPKTQTSRMSKKL